MMVNECRSVFHVVLICLKSVIGKHFCLEEIERRKSQATNATEEKEKKKHRMIKRSHFIALKKMCNRRRLPKTERQLYPPSDNKTCGCQNQLKLI